jgi:transglutaminase-like putative cysteine protease
MPQLYKILTAILAFTGCISLIVSGGINPLMSLTGIGFLPGYYRFLKGMPHAHKWTIGGLSIIAFLVFILDSLIISKDSLLGVAHLTITFQAIKSFDLKEPWDHLQVYFMTLLQLIIASELTYSIAFGVVFIFFLIVLVAAIIIAHFVKEEPTFRVDIKRPLIYISLLTLLSTVIFFISIPRVSGKLFGKSHTRSIKTAGFAETVDFGSFGNVKLDPTIVMRVELSNNVKAPYYWRGLTLNYFDGTSWRDTLRERKWIYKEEGRFTIKPFDNFDNKVITQKVFLEAMDTDVVFGLSEIAALESEGRILFIDDAGALFLPAKKGKRFNYTVYSVSELQKIEDFLGTPLCEPVAKGGLTRGTESPLCTNYLQLPAGMSRISRLTHTITEGTDNDLNKTIKIEDYLRKNYTYSLSTSPLPEGINPIEDFLFNSKKGYCEHYATAMVLMLRATGIPARIVTGFLGEEVNEYGDYIIVRQSNAHSWVEAAIDGRWRRFDPTPQVSAETPSVLALYLDMLRLNWQRYVVSFSLSDQKEIAKALSIPFKFPLMPNFRARGFSGIIYILLSLSSIILTIFLLKYLRNLKRYGFVTAQYMKLKNEIKNKGAKITPSSTSSEVKQEALRLGIMSDRIAEFITLYEEHRFGGRMMGKNERAWYQKLLKEIKKKEIK